MDTRIHGIVVEPLGAADRGAVHALLRAHRLPLEGFDDDHVVRLVAKDGGAVVGSAAVEVYGRYGLLRSVAVADAYRGRSLGSLLTREAVAVARTRGLVALYLLTETAAAFFPKFGFTRIARADIPVEVTQSVEFRSACPASAEAFAVRLVRD